MDKDITSGIFHAVISRDENVLKIKLPSALDKKNAADVLAGILEAIDADTKSILFDAAELKYISADGLDVILETRKLRDG